MTAFVYGSTSQEFIASFDALGAAFALADGLDMNFASRDNTVTLELDRLRF